MQENDLKNYVRKKLKSGYPSGEIKHSLRLKGLTDDEIDNLFNSLIKPGNNNTPIYSSENTTNQTYLLIGVCLFITGIALLSLNTDSLLGIFLSVVGIAFMAPFLLKKISKDFKR